MLRAYRSGLLGFLVEYLFCEVVLELYICLKSCQVDLHSLADVHLL